MRKAFTSTNEKDARARSRDLRVTSKQTPKGFTLIEMMVAVSIFAIVMMVGVGALLALVEANRHAEAVNSVMQNLNAALESMTRTARVGTTYHCEASPNTLIGLDTTKDCAASGGLLFAFEPSAGDPSVATDQVVYRLNGSQIERSLAGGAANSWVAITAPEVHIDSLKFFVVGSGAGNTTQSRVVINIHGSAKIPGGTTTFSVQAGITQRLPDI